MEKLISRAVEVAPVGPCPQDRKLVIVTPTAMIDFEQGARVDVARSVCWWEPGMPVYCKLVNRKNQSEMVVADGSVARMLALSVRDAARFEGLFDSRPSVVDPSVAPPETEFKQPVAAMDHTLEPLPNVKVEDVDKGTR